MMSTNIGNRHPAMRPNFRCRPDLDKGMPILRLSRACAWLSPKARRHEKDKPGIPVLLRLFAMLPTPSFLSLSDNNGVQ